MHAGGSAAGQSPARATLLALQAQLEHSEHLSRSELGAMQFRRLDQVLRHAWQQLPFWRERLAACGYDPALPLTAAVFARLIGNSMFDCPEASQMSPTMMSSTEIACCALG